MTQFDQMADVVNKLASAQLDTTHMTLRFQARLDVQTFVLGQLLAGLAENTKLVASIQTALEMASEKMLPKNPAYDAAFVEERDGLLAFLPKD